jgi:hypothetical protein
MNLFGVQTAWDVVDEVLVRYFNERLTTSPRQRLAVTRPRSAPVAVAPVPPYAQPRSI